MEELIKNKSLIDDCQVNGLATTYTLMNLNEKNKKTKLGEVLNYLPHGIIDKTETGIGGTSLELDSNRNSIVVVPFNNIADCKSQIKSIGNKYDIHFYSSDDYFKNNNVTYKLKKPILNKYSLKTNDPESRLYEYIIKCEKDEQKIKIICILNQLENLYEYLKTLKNYQVNEFHLVLDEIDTLQEQSSFRGEATKCYNIYKEHPPKKSTMISATLVKFHDPYFLDKPLTIFKYKQINKPKIYLTQIQNIKEEAVRVIINLILNNNYKILVSCNNFTYSQEIIETLEKELKKLKKRKTIKIICSNNSIKSAGNYYAKIENCMLPADITFMTAAFFSGHDITERYHNIILAEKQTTSLRISPRLIYQITGRCRDEEGPYSNQLIINFNSNINIKYNLYTSEELINSVKDQKVIFDFINNIKHSSNKYMTGIIESIENILYEGTSEIPSVNEKESTGLPVISFFKVDSRIEEQNTFNLYNNPSDFYDVLAEKFILTNNKAIYQPGDIKLIAKKDPKVVANCLLIKLNKLDRNIDFTTELRIINSEISSPSHPVEITLISIYTIALDNNTINLTKLSIAIDRIVKNEQINGRLDELDFYLKFNKYVLTDPIFQDNITVHLPVGEIFSVKELKNKIKTIIETMKKLSKTEKINIKHLITKLKKRGDLFFRNTLLQTQSKRKNNLPLFKIIGYDKFELFSD